ncbi:hypothetical protein GF378_02780 [Candidatus Pacearchaeota archaeon]|nr:hypothetical protein [Candidatus Pacearchaeota archaeon]
MTKSKFKQRKGDILSKEDKSSVGRWDARMIPLCEKINSLEGYYTTSSCSGRIVIMLDKEKKQSGLFLSKYHEEINPDQILEDLERNRKKSPKAILKFKQEPPILHIHCETLEKAQKLLKKAQLAGFKKSGIISSGKRIILEINGTNKMEFPIIKKGKVLTDADFLKVVIKKSNDNLKKGWKKINKLKKSL